MIRKDGSIRQWGYWSQGGYEIAKTLSNKLLGFVDYTAPKPKRTPKPADVKVVEPSDKIPETSVDDSPAKPVVKPDIPDTLVDESSPTLSPPREPKHNVIHIGIRTDSFSHKHDDYVLHVHAFDYTGYRLTNGYYHLFMSHDTVQKMVSIPETPVVVVPDVEIDLPIKQVKPAVYTGDYEVELAISCGFKRYSRSFEG